MGVSHLVRAASLLFSPGSVHAGRRQVSLSAHVTHDVETDARLGSVAATPDELGPRVDGHHAVRARHRGEMVAIRIPGPQAVWLLCTQPARDRCAEAHAVLSCEVGGSACAGSLRARSLVLHGASCLVLLDSSDERIEALPAGGLFAVGREKGGHLAE